MRATTEARLAKVEGRYRNRQPGTHRLTDDELQEPHRLAEGSRRGTGRMGSRRAAT
jgi:hypothetical protein